VAPDAGGDRELCEAPRKIVAGTASSGHDEQADRAAEGLAQRRSS
jgi:hypothetical protein